MDLKKSGHQLAAGAEGTNKSYYEYSDFEKVSGKKGYPGYLT